jgi:hypothetical protein
MSDTPYAPVIRSQADLEDAWRHLLGPLGFSGHSLWLMFVQPDGVPLPHLSQVEDCVTPPTDVEQANFVALLKTLRREMRKDERLVFLRSRPGRGGARPDDLACTPRAGPPTSRPTSSTSPPTTRWCRCRWTRCWPSRPDRAPTTSACADRRRTEI